MVFWSGVLIQRRGVQTPSMPRTKRGSWHRCSWDIVAKVNARLRSELGDCDASHVHDLLRRMLESNDLLKC